ncbi:Flp pilus assembly protein TadG [Arthrobacter pascens]|nr:Flp pilus assembly protein TadG [Arthrobacter pascens]
MLQSSPEPRGQSLPALLHERLGEALCRGSGGPPSKTCPSTNPRQLPEPEQGSAVVEFTFLALLLMVPLVYFIITLGQIQGGAFAVTGAADQAAKVYVGQPDARSAQTAAEQAALIALADYGHNASEARVSTSCDQADCRAAGSAVTVTVHLTVSLPFVPFSDDFRLNVSEVEASSTQLVGRFR